MSEVNWKRWKCAVERAGQRMRQSGLAHAGDILDQQVAARKQAHQRELDHFVFAPDHALHGLLHALEQFRQATTAWLINFRAFSMLTASPERIAPARLDHETPKSAMFNDCRGRLTQR